MKEKRFKTDGWMTLDSAPKGVPVRVFASFDPSDPRMTWREHVAEDKYGIGRWTTLGRRSLRVYPTHWKPLLPPNLG